MDKHLYLLATFDDDTSKRMGDIQRAIRDLGIIGRQTPDIPFHITLTRFDSNHEDEVRLMLREVCAQTDKIDIAFNSVGLFGLNVLFLAPDVSYQLLNLYGSLSHGAIKEQMGWTAHATILIDEQANTLRALPVVAEKFKHIEARIEKISLYEFFPTRFVAEYSLK